MEKLKSLAALAFWLFVLGYVIWGCLTAEIDRKKINEMDRNRRKTLGLDDPVRLQPENHRQSTQNRHSDRPGQAHGEKITKHIDKETA